MIAALATVVAAVIVGQMIWNIKLGAQIAEMRRTWKPRNQGVLSPMPLKWNLYHAEQEDIQVEHEAA